MRISEIIHLECGDIDLDQMLLTVRLTKFNKSRLIPLDPSTVKKLKLYLQQNAIVSVPDLPRPAFSCPIQAHRSPAAWYDGLS